MRAERLISYGAFPPCDVLAQDIGQLTKSQADKFEHPIRQHMGFLRGVSKDAIVSQKGY